MTIVNHTYRIIKGWRIRATSALRCLLQPHYVLVTWTRAQDGDLDFRITHKGAEITEAIHRLKVDAAEILQDICDQEDGLDITRSIVG